jgi:hypothetical protein
MEWITETVYRSASGGPCEAARYTSRYDKNKMIVGIVP